MDDIFVNRKVEEDFKDSIEQNRKHKNSGSGC